MKKLIIIIFCFFTFAFCRSAQAQSYTFTSDGDTIKLSTIYGTITGDTSSSMSAYGIQYYGVAVKVNGSDSMKVSYNAALTNYFYTETSPAWNWVGKFKSTLQSDLWFLPPNGTSITVLFAEIIK